MLVLQSPTRHPHTVPEAINALRSVTVHAAIGHLQATTAQRIAMRYPSAFAPESEHYCGVVFMQQGRYNDSAWDDARLYARRLAQRTAEDHATLFPHWDREGNGTSGTEVWYFADGSEIYAPNDREFGDVEDCLMDDLTDAAHTVEAKQARDNIRVDDLSADDLAALLMTQVWRPYFGGRTRAHYAFTLPKEHAAPAPTQPTIAQATSNMFNNDGLCFHDADGASLLTYLANCYATTARNPNDPDDLRYTFMDRSAITISGAAWDLGYAECFCWQTVGHNDDCPHREGR